MKSELALASKALRGTVWWLVLMSGVINVLYLTGSFFMLEVYDRVLPSHSIPTLVGLGIIAALLYVGQAILDLIRSRICNRLGDMLDARLGKRVYDAVVRLPLRLRGNGDSQQPMRDLDQVRSFLASGGPLAFLDLPFMPLYLFICFMFHFWIGLAAIAGMLILVWLAYYTERKTKKAIQESFGLVVERNALVESGRRNAEALRAMGMGSVLAHRWEEANQRYLKVNRTANDTAKGVGSVTKAVRAAIQSFVLALGAFLVIKEEATAGVIIASSILVARALAPVELSIGSWKGFTQARQAWERLKKLLAFIHPDANKMELPRPYKTLSVAGVSVAAPGGDTFVVENISFQLQHGQALCIIGPSAAGKSSLARLLTGVWPPARGCVRLDEAALEHWAAEQLGKHIGYLPQDVELLAGTVAENIARFQPNADPRTVVAAARDAGVHEMILRLPKGYDSQIGEGGIALSAGQRQRIGLARALYGRPFLVVLDEPNANLDADGDNALTEAVLAIRARGGIAVVIAHRPSALAAASHVLIMQNGRVAAFKPRQAELQVVQAAE